MLRGFLLLLLPLLLLFSCHHQEGNRLPVHAPFLQIEVAWADSVLQQMTTEEKIGQLLVWAPKQPKALDREKLWGQVARGQLSGLLLQDLPLDSFTQVIDSARQLANLPLLIGSRQSIALNNQFSDVVPFPLPATFRSTGQDSLIHALEDRYVAQCRALGINFSLAPSLNRNHPDVLCFDFECYESEPEPLMEQATRLMYKLQNQHILAVARDFKDFYYLPNDTTHFLDSLLTPYLHLAINGLSGLQADTLVFAEDTSRIEPLDFLKNYTKQHFDFGGLHWAATQKVAEVDRLFLAGTDVLLVSDSLEAHALRLRQLVDDGFLSERMLNEKVGRILMAKSWIQQGTEVEPEDKEQALAQLRDPEQAQLTRQYYEASLTLAQNPEALLPFKGLHQKRFQVLQVGPKKLKYFLREFDRYAHQSHQHWLPEPGSDSLPALQAAKWKRKTLVLTLDSVDLQADRQGAFIRSVNAIARQTEVALINFGNPFNLQYFDTTVAMIQVLERNPTTEAFVAQALFGARDTPGQLPLFVATHLPQGHGGSLPIIRLRRGLPEEVGIAAYQLVGIDAIARSAIAKKAMPGCQVMVIKDGKIIYDKNFGHQSIHRRRAVRSSDLYDVASITKVAATTLALMKLQETGQVRLNDRLDKHLELGKKSPLKRTTVKQLLTHQSGLQSHLPITPYVMARDSNSRDCQSYFCKEKREPFTIAVADSFYMDSRYVDTIWQDVYQLKPSRRKRFRYSDVNFALLHKVVESQTEKSFDTYLQQQFFNPLHLRRTAFRPLEQFPRRDIIPTAYDEKWRKQVIRGHVHDETAALFNGVAGNAGLFSNTQDLATLFQMLLNGGTYGGKRYLQKETIDLFTKKQYKSKRGLGFDLRNGNSRRQACSPKASSQTYGHTGFTGTCVWVDPEESLVFVFLTNRINENAKNKRIFRDQVRRRIHTVIYDALDSYPQEQKGLTKLALEAMPPRTLQQAKVSLE